MHTLSKTSTASAGIYDETTSVSTARESSIHLPKVEHLVTHGEKEDWIFKEEIDPRRVNFVNYHRDGSRIDVTDVSFRRSFDDQRDVVIKLSPSFVIQHNEMTDLEHEGIRQHGDISKFEAVRDPKRDDDYMIILVSRQDPKDFEIISKDTEAKDLFWKLWKRLASDYLNHEEKVSFHHDMIHGPQKVLRG